MQAEGEVDSATQLTNREPWSLAFDLGGVCKEKIATAKNRKGLNQSESSQQSDSDAVNAS